MIMSENNSFSQRLTDVDTGSNFNPIEGLNESPLLSFPAAIEYAQSKDSEFSQINFEPRIFCAQIFADNFEETDTQLTSDEISVIHFYTQESPFYKILNERLRNRDRTTLKAFFPILKLLMTAILKLPPVQTTVYRGVKKNLGAKYKTGKREIWWSFGSSTASIDVLNSDQFLGITGDRTMFNIATVTARDISGYSAIQTERELLLLPGSVFIVEGVLELSKELYVIQLKESIVPGLVDLQTPKIIVAPPKQNKEPEEEILVDQKKVNEKALVEQETTITADEIDMEPKLNKNLGTLKTSANTEPVNVVTPTINPTAFIDIKPSTMAENEKPLKQEPSHKVEPENKTNSTKSKSNVIRWGDNFRCPGCDMSWGFYVARGLFNLVQARHYYNGNRFIYEGLGSAMQNRAMGNGGNDQCGYKSDNNCPACKTRLRWV
eukprot:TRINITY_DN9767_c0_g1_i1.p1 TRINITY_DN9767_c0_g1~~TRINITY_DN9767_c0_g1_i1.p1  ORF type:complete len:435 (+),score=-0.25 TRINITY_DN9767_c0_g1_i1:447-1751(+)